MPCRGVESQKRSLDLRRENQSYGLCVQEPQFQVDLRLEDGSRLEVTQVLGHFTSD